MAAQGEEEAAVAHVPLLFRAFSDVTHDPRLRRVRGLHSCAVGKRSNASSLLLQTHDDLAEDSALQEEGRRPGSAPATASDRPAVDGEGASLLPPDQDEAEKERRMRQQVIASSIIGNLLEWYEEEGG